VPLQIHQIRTPQGSLRDRALKAGAWTLGAYGADLSVRLISNLILTRLLFPEAFGAIAAASALIFSLVLISDFGVRAVIIQSPHGEQVEFLRTAWVFQLWRGVFLYVILAVICALISTPMVRDLLPNESVFANRSFPLITISLGFVIVLSGAESVCVHLSARHLNYKPLVVLDFVGRISSLPIMIIWAWIAPSVWALVGGSLTSSLLRLVLSHLWVPGPWMAFKWDRDYSRQIVHFGRWIVVSSFASFVGQQSDVILLGILMPGSMLGLYSIAKQLAGTGEGLLDRINSSLALPVLGEVIRKNSDKLRDHYYHFRLPIDVVAALLGGCLFAAGSFIVGFLYDARYAEAGLMLQILALGLVSYPFSIIGSAFTAMGDNHVAAFISILKAASLVASVTIGYLAFGLLGSIVGIASHRIIPSTAIVFLAHHRNWIDLWREARIFPVFVLGALIGKGTATIILSLGIENIHQLLR
jgi:O-antigen/teichoic acid export membrane protein